MMQYFVMKSKVTKYFEVYASTVPRKSLCDNGLVCNM